MKKTANPRTTKKEKDKYFKAHAHKRSIQELFFG